TIRIRCSLLFSSALPHAPTLPLFPYTTLFRSCILVYQPPLGEQAEERLKIMTATADGFVIAERDLELRGFGDDEPVSRRRHDLRSEEHTSELQSRSDLVCRLLLEKKNKKIKHI